MADGFDKECASVRHDHGLICLKNYNSKRVDYTRKNLIKIFKNNGSNSKVMSNLKTVTLIDVTFNLVNENYIENPTAHRYKH